MQCEAKKGTRIVNVNYYIFSVIFNILELVKKIYLRVLIWYKEYYCLLLLQGFFICSIITDAKKEVSRRI